MADERGALGRSTRAGNWKDPVVKAKDWRTSIVSFGFGVVSGVAGGWRGSGMRGRGDGPCP